MQSRDDRFHADHAVVLNDERLRKEWVCWEDNEGLFHIPLDARETSRCARKSGNILDSSFFLSTKSSVNYLRYPINNVQGQADRTFTPRELSDVAKLG